MSWWICVLSRDMDLGFVLGCGIVLWECRFCRDDGEAGAGLGMFKARDDFGIP